MMISRSAQADPSTSNYQATPEQIAQLAALLTQAAQDRQATEQPAGSYFFCHHFLSTYVASTPEVSLTDILTPANLTPLFASHPELIPSLFPHLPPDLPVPPSAEVLNRIIK
jgi:26S proteasome regulatory subunit N13